MARAPRSRVETFVPTGSLTSAIPLREAGADATGIAGYGEYEIDIENVLREKLPSFFDNVNATPLLESHIKALPAQAKGAYMLFQGENPIPVYAGKTDAEHGFQDRLLRHAWTIKGRKGLDPLSIRFKAMRIMVFAALDVEALLIRRLKESNPTALEWNFSGFGSNDPGQGRDGQRPAKFDQEHPIDEDFPIMDLPDGEISLSDLLEHTKRQLPYLFRFDDVPSPVRITSPPAGSPFRSVLEIIVRALPPGWQGTILHGRAILYPRHTNFQHLQAVFRS
jgi:hypothetical protein